MKYVMFNNRVPVIFPTFIEHADLAEKLKPLKPTTAGFVKLEGGKLLAHGKSESLGLASSPVKDTAILNTYFDLFKNRG
jgi:hypothetical protein